MIPGSFFLAAVHIGEKTINAPETNSSPLAMGCGPDKEEQPSEPKGSVSHRGPAQQDYKTSRSLDRTIVSVQALQAGCGRGPTD